MASEAVLRRLDRIGQGAITAEQGLLSLNTLLRSASATVSAAKLPQLAVNAFIWDRYLQSGGKAGATARANTKKLCAGAPRQEGTHANRQPWWSW